LRQGSTLALIWWFVELTWQVDWTSCHLSSDLKRGLRRGWQANLTSATCHVGLSNSNCAQNASVGPWSATCHVGLSNSNCAQNASVGPWKLRSIKEEGSSLFFGSSKQVFLFEKDFWEFERVIFKVRRVKCKVRPIPAFLSSLKSRTTLGQFLSTVFAIEWHLSPTSYSPVWYFVVALRRSQDQICSRTSLDSWIFSSEFWVLGTFSSNVEVNSVNSWNGHNSFQRIFPLKFSEFYNTSTSGAFLLMFLFRKEPFKSMWEILVDSRLQWGFMNPLHSPRNEHSKTEFNKTILRKSSENRRLFPGSNLILRPALNARGLCFRNCP